MCGSSATRAIASSRGSARSVTSSYRSGLGRPDFLAGHADFLIQHPQHPGPVKPARAVNQKLVHENAWPGYWPRSQCPGAMSSRASGGPHDPGTYGTTLGGLASSGAATSHTAARPSGRVNSDRSPSSTSWMSRT